MRGEPLTLLRRWWRQRPREPSEIARSRRSFWANATLALVGAVVLWLLPDLVHLQNSVWRLLSITALYVIAVIGLNLVFGMAGQVTLGPAAVFAVGAYVSGVLSARSGLDSGLAVAAGVIAAGIVGVLIGMPALRVGGFYLAMVTAFAAQAVPASVNLAKQITGGQDGLVGIAALSMAGAPLDAVGRYRLAILATLAIALLVSNVSGSAWGRWFRCLTASEVGTSALGVSVYQAKVVAFLLSALFGGLAGGLYAQYQRVLSPFEFGFDLSLTLFASLVIGGLGSLWGPVLGTVLFVLGPHYLLPSAWGPNAAQVVYGALLIAIMVLIPDGIAAAWAGLGTLGRRLGVAPGPPSAPMRAGGVDVATLMSLLSNARLGQGQALRAEDVHKRFGGIRALQGVSLDVAPGAITALIGPNGSGKTTLLNVCCGYLAPDAGRVLLEGRDVTPVPAYRRARAGLARTLQHSIIFSQLSGSQNVMAGHARARPSPWAALLGLPRSRAHEREAAAHAEAILAALGAGHLVEKPGGALSLAESRILELARALALDPTVLVLDEPAAGLDLEEVEVVGAVVRAARDAGIAVLLVDHDVSFVTKLADRVLVLDQGLVIFDGPPSEVRRDPLVAAAYFGALDPGVSAA